MLNFDPWEEIGPRDQGELTRRFEEAYRANCQAHDFGVNMTGIYITLFSGFIDLFGWEMLLLAAGPTDTVHRALDRVRQFLGRELGLIKVRANVVCKYLQRHTVHI